MAIKMEQKATFQEKAERMFGKEFSSQESESDNDEDWMDNIEAWRDNNNNNLYMCVRSI